MENITFEEIEARSNTLMGIDPNHTYQISYRHFVNYFDVADELTIEHLICGSNMAYGWMPRILNYKNHEFENSLRLLNDAKNGEILEDDQIISLKNLFNNSFVGTSKILHFVNPSLYAIWDSKVYKFLVNYRRRSGANYIQNFSPYLRLCRRLVDDPRFADLQPEFEAHLGYEVSPMRKLELIMFTNHNTPLR